MKEGKVEELIVPGNTLELSELKIVDSAKEVEEFFEDAIVRGLEGIMGKSLMHHTQQVQETLTGQS